MPLHAGRKKRDKGGVVFFRPFRRHDSPLHLWPRLLYLGAVFVSDRLCLVCRRMRRHARMFRIFDLLSDRMACAVCLRGKRSMQLTVRDVVRLLKVPEKTVYRWIKEDAMPATLVGEQYRFVRAELLEWAMARQINLPADFFPEAEKGAAKSAGFLDALVAGGIHGGIVAHDRESALQAVVRTMPLSDDAGKEFLYDMLLARETLSSTGMGDGIAIPHARNPMVLHVPKSMISLCLLDEPVEFGAVDGRPVYALFSVISLTVRDHLHLLSRLAFALHDEGFKGAVLRRATAEDILKEARRVEAAMVQRDDGTNGVKTP